MTVYFNKARGRWNYDFRLGGHRFASVCLDSAGRPVTSRRGAIEAEAEAKRAARIAPKLPRAIDLMFGDVMNALSEGWMRKPGWPERQRMVRELLDFFGPATAMRDIDGARIQDYITFALAQPLMVWRGGPTKTPGSLVQRWKPHPEGKTRSSARVNRFLPLLRAAFARAYNTRDPLTRERAIDEIPPIRDLAETKRKARPVPDDVLTRIMERLPSHLAEATRLTLFFGLRQSEVFSLTISQVDFQARGLRLDGDKVKDREDAFLPGGSHAMQFLAQLVDQARERGVRHLITWRPGTGGRRSSRRPESLRWRPIRSPKSAWKTAMDAVQAEMGARWRWHDIRAAFITQVALTAGAVAAQKMARHSDFKTTQGYVEVADDVMRDAADKAAMRPALGVVKGGKS